MTRTIEDIKRFIKYNIGSAFCRDLITFIDGQGEKIDELQTQLKTKDKEIKRLTNVISETHLIGYTMIHPIVLEMCVKLKVALKKGEEDA